MTRMDRPIRLYDTLLRRFDHNPHPYVILSHRWDENEPTSRQVQSYYCRPTPLSPKFQQFCNIAHELYGCRYVWMDSICIDQDNERELDASIRSMFSWYQNAEICVVYLRDAHTFDDIWTSSWFTRGWTLQELLAPRRIAFFLSNWERIFPNFDCEIDRTGGHAPSVLVPLHFRRLPNETACFTSSLGRFSEPLQKLALAAGVPDKYLLHNYSPSPLNLTLIREWARTRETTLPEDVAYSLVSLLNVCVPPRYGIGSETALNRLETACHDATEIKDFDANAARFDPL
ncbi:hypothetical protein ONZ45_g3881 [Pleurotus djamor]|nr:hypothetical protein ONZ45_g3881 [Pleurotus djamor]